MALIHPCNHLIRQQIGPCHPDLNQSSSIPTRFDLFLWSRFFHSLVSNHHHPLDLIVILSSWSLDGVISLWTECPLNASLHYSLLFIDEIICLWVRYFVCWSDNLSRGRISYLIVSLWIGFMFWDLIVCLWMRLNIFCASLGLTDLVVALQSCDCLIFIHFFNLSDLDSGLFTILHISKHHWSFASFESFIFHLSVATHSCLSICKRNIDLLYVNASYCLSSIQLLVICSSCTQHPLICICSMMFKLQLLLQRIWVWGVGRV